MDYIAKLKINEHLYKVSYVMFANLTKCDLYLTSCESLTRSQIKDDVFSDDFKALLNMDIFKGRIDSVEINKICYQKSCPIHGKKDSNTHIILSHIKNLIN